MTRTSTVIKHTIATVYNSLKDLGFLSKVRWIQCPSNYNSLTDVGFLSKVRWIQCPSNYNSLKDVGFLSKVRWIQCPSNHNNIKGCWIPIQGPMDPVSIQPQQY